MNQNVVPDLIVRAPNIRTMDPACPIVQAFAVKRGLITAVTDSGDLEQIRGSETVVQDYESDLTVMPGLGDIHAHLYVAGHTQEDGFRVDSSWTSNEIVTEIGRAVERTPAGSWLVGGYLSIDQLERLSEPDMREYIDAASGTCAVMLRDTSLHARFVNSRAIELIGLSDTAVERNSEVIPLGIDGKPTGVLYERASGWAEATWVDLDPAASKGTQEAVASAIGYLNSLGITRIQDAASSESFIEALLQLEERGVLNSWITASASVNDQIFGTQPTGRELLDRVADHTSKYVRPKFAKLFLDGNPFSRTAVMHEPYIDGGNQGSDWRGKPTLSQGELNEWFQELAHRGIGAKVHVAGDRAVTMCLEAKRAVLDAGLEIDVQLAHANLIRPEDLPLIRKLEVVIDASPPTLWYPSAFTANLFDNLGLKAQDKWSQFRTLKDNGIAVAGGSDMPCGGETNPWLGMQTMVTRSDPYGIHPGAMNPDQGMSREEAMAAYTVESAKAMGLGDETGTLTIGKQADFIIMSQDPFTVPIDRLHETKVLETWFSGRRVYIRD